ncbi:phosphoglycerate mutase-like protein [Mycena alexandri]|uniref:Phosphoglycerate mutase-like protein n=1 Tax=Mycena alexandri TaxID=1745969 RepID=A0AAD6SIP0_9AGAR|nr:phosphoglycerate mutase-like protein [Mycena alexandri]
MLRTALLLIGSLVARSACAAAASSFVGSTSTAVFPPPEVTLTSDASFFPDATQVNVFGPTPTGDEAFAIETAPVSPDYSNVFPLIAPGTSDKKTFDVIHSWGNLSPFRSNNNLGLPNSSPKVPDGCSLTQVHLLHRHGARYPTSGSAPSSFAAALHAVAATGNLSASGPLAFLNTWTYKLGAEILTPFGRAQLFELGVGFRVKYGDLLKGFTDLPVWRTTSEERMVDSALHFAAGFFGVQEYQNDYHQLIEIEELGFNSTLAPYEQCPNANNIIATTATNSTNQWVSIYLADAQKRLAPHLKGLTLNATWLFAMQQTCAYETVALGYSAFCDLFTEEEWKGYEYAVDLAFWYNNGPGNPAVAAQGIGWVQELASRLSQTRITEFASTVNGTIVGSNITFPLSQPIFVDATHDTVISAIVVAMNFTSLAATGPLPATHIPADRSYVVNQISPFGSNMVGQVLSCPSTPSSNAASNANSTTTPTHIRWLLNDAVVPLTGIAGCTHNADGLCEFDTFVKGMQQRVVEVDFAFGCFGNYTVPSPDLIVDGQLPARLRS